eukprot:scaffold34636_cov171-Amphora_coffeaeformis.AAC.1
MVTTRSRKGRRLFSRFFRRSSGSGRSGRKSSRTTTAAADDDDDNPNHHVPSMNRNTRRTKQSHRDDNVDVSPKVSGKPNKNVVQALFVDSHSMETEKNHHTNGNHSCWTTTISLPNEPVNQDDQWDSKKNNCDGNDSASSNGTGVSKPEQQGKLLREWKSPTKPSSSSSSSSSCQSSKPSRRHIVSTLDDADNKDSPSKASCLVWNEENLKPDNASVSSTSSMWEDMPSVGFPTTANLNNNNNNREDRFNEEHKEMEAEDAYVPSGCHSLDEESFFDSTINLMLLPTKLDMAIPMEEEEEDQKENKGRGATKPRLTKKDCSPSTPLQVHPPLNNTQNQRLLQTAVPSGSRVALATSHHGLHGEEVENTENHDEQNVINETMDVESNAATVSIASTGTDNDRAEIPIGARVRITSKADHGVEGIVKEMEHKNLYKVECCVDGNLVLLAKVRKSLQWLDNNNNNARASIQQRTHATSSSGPTNGDNNQTMPVLPIGARVRIISKTDKGVEGIVKEMVHTNLYRVECLVDGNLEIKNKVRKSLRCLNVDEGQQLEPTAVSPNSTIESTRLYAPDSRVLVPEQEYHRTSRNRHLMSNPTQTDSEQIESPHREHTSPGQNCPSLNTHEPIFTSGEIIQEAPSRVQNQAIPDSVQGRSSSTTLSQSNSRSRQSNDGTRSRYSRNISNQPIANQSHGQLSPSRPWLNIGEYVKVTKGSRAGERGVVTNLTARTATVATHGGSEYKPHHNSLRPLAAHDSDNGEMKVTDFDCEAQKIGDSYIVSLVFSDEAPNSQSTILSYIFGNRLLIWKCQFDPKRETTAPRTVLTVDDSVYELIATRIREDENMGRFSSKYKHFDCYYVKISGPDVEYIDVKQVLNQYADFTSLSAYKIAARMDLLTSPGVTFPADPSITKHASSVFKLIPNSDEYEGCGFISEKMLEQLVVDRDLDVVTGVQVRILVPKYGLFKGELMRKRYMHGDHHIELNTSMQKAGPSIHENLHDWGIVAIRQVQPSETNLCIGKMLDPANNWRPTKSFKAKIKPLSKMITPFLLHMGVPQYVLDDYVKNAREPEDLRHTWVVGMADPTGSLSPGHIFVPGFKGTVELDKIFITRSPCREPDDGRMLPMISKRPTGMSQEHWEELNDLPFGSVVFANPKPGMKSLPPFVANGDLDGDLYFICWDAIVLSFLVATPVPEEPAESDDGEAHAGAGEAWLAKAQAAMIENAFNHFALAQLQGKLYKLSEKIGIESEEGVAHPDAVAYGRAYKNVLDYPKHRRPIVLPAHLMETIPTALHKYLTTTTVSL